MTNRDIGPRRRTKSQQSADWNLSGKDYQLAALARALFAVRTKVYKESRGVFAGRLNVSEMTLRRMESASPGITIGTWFQALRLMQVDAAVVDAIRPDALLFTAQMASSNNMGIGKAMTTATANARENTRYPAERASSLPLF